MKGTVVNNFTITESNHIIFKCYLNNKICRLIIDTGASNSCINYFSAKRFDMKLEKSSEIASSATNKINETYYSKNNKLKIGDFEKTNFEVVLFDMTFLNNSLKEKEISEVDGIIGSDILYELNACINYKKKEIILEF